MFGHNADAPARTTVTNQLTSFDGARETYRSPRPCGSGRRKIRFPIARAHNSQMYAHTRSVGGITESYASDQRARALGTQVARFSSLARRAQPHNTTHTHILGRVCARALARSTPLHGAEQHAIIMVKIYDMLEYRCTHTHADYTGLECIKCFGL